MAKYFLGTVGKAEAFRRNDQGALELAFVSKTLTDSGINISTTKDDIRGGQGAPIQFSFYHDPNVEITLTDIQWKPEYLEAQLGARFGVGNEEYVTEELTFTDGAATPGHAVHKAPLPCGHEYLVWGAKQGTDEWELLEYDAEQGKIKLPGTHTGEEVYCVRYLGASTKAMIADINSMIIPEELFLIITAPIFAGDACAASRGKAAGHITFEVPRFLLNGAQEFQMNMSSNQTMSLAGIALASESADCAAEGGKLLRVIEVLESRDWRAQVTELIADEDYLAVGDIPAIYGMLKDGSIIKIDNAYLVFAPANTTPDPVINAGTGAWAASEADYDATITLKIGDETIATETVTVAGTGT